jgi:hypothetical protein
LLARQIELEHFGREPDCLLRREPLDFDKHVEHFTSYKFTRLYRLSKDDFANLVTLLSPRLRRAHSRPLGCAAAIDPRIMTAVTLRYLAGGKILDLGWPYGLGDSTVYAVIYDTIDAMDEALQNITFPSTAEDAQREAEAWQRLRGSPL